MASSIQQQQQLLQPPSQLSQLQPQAQAQPQPQTQPQPQLQSQSQQYPSPSQGTPPQPPAGVGISGNLKRGPQPKLPPPRAPQQPSPSTAAVPGSLPTGPPAQSSFKNAELTPAARRKASANKRKAPEKQLPDRVAALLPESSLYSQLLEFEARVDATLARKKIDIQEAIKNPPRVQRTLRIYVFNTFANQNQGANSAQGEPPSWTLRIIGRILEDGVDPDMQAASKPNPSAPKFSSFFRRITVLLDPTLYPENPQIVWDGARASAHVEGFEIKRKGDKEFKATIRLEMNYTPEKYKLSAALTDLLRIEVDTRPRIISALWQYIKVKKLQDAADPTMIICDPPLKRIFGEEKFKVSLVSQKLSQHLQPPQPILLEHHIKLSGHSPAGNACYDVAVDVPIPLQKEMSAFLANLERHKDIDMYDETIRTAIKKIHEHRRRRAFFLGFSQSPVDFINTLIASQSRDLKVVAGEASRNPERERRSDFYNQPWVEDAVIRYLNRPPPAAGPDAPGNT
ncbi:hypothetical protein KP509_23G016000 [Ceratopteris richardii]|uniref:DM2 domain-containing protein n=1 Tax=Ceratopteris richardii TaxID=49495 RepID=A0A8T2RZC4_CERRI|nr:hypothetical protein KP509_23G016000 [Ceratopteris richardii]